ncbi:hypothetical protein ACWEF6_01695 [Amycolatopsis sp. NPDC004772]
MTRFTTDATGETSDSDTPRTALTDYGFQYGAGLWERLADFRGTTVVRLTPDHGSNLEIYVSPTGRSVRVFREGRELK